MMQSRLSLQQLILALSTTLLGLTLHLSGGMYAGFAVAMLLVVLGMLLAALLGKDLSRPANLPAIPFLGGLIALELFAMLFTPQGESLLDAPPPLRAVYIAAVALAGCGVLWLSLGKAPRAGAGFVLILGAFAALGIATIRQTPAPPIDVFTLQTNAAQALAHGQNPYAITMPDVYGPSFPYYPAGAVRDGRVQYGYLYPPLPLLVTTPATLVLGDVRYTYLLCLLGTAMLVGCLRRDRVGLLLAALLLLAPSSLLLLKMSWTEPLAALLLAATVLCAVRRSRWLPLMLGCLLASKQFLPATIALVPLLGHERPRRVIVQSLLVAAAVSLPLALWDLQAFFHSALGYHLRAPFRPDSLSVLAWLAFQFPGAVPPGWLAFAAILLAGSICLRKATRSPAGFSLSFAICYLLFFAFSKQAFGNYYALVLTAAAVAASASRAEQSSASPALRPGRIDVDSKDTQMKAA
jgi:hypothetical protein